MSFFQLLFAVVIFLNDCTGKPTPPLPTTVSETEVSNMLPEVESEEVRTKALDQLRNVFGFTNRSHFSPAKDHAPPQYMVDLYNTITDAGGITEVPNANTVRSYLDKSHRQRMLYSFNLTNIPSTDRILRAELHLFKLKPKVKHDPTRQHYYQVHLYKVTTDNPLSTEGAELIGLRLISTQRNDWTGWEVFTVTDVVESWIKNSTTNLGFLLRVTNLNGEVIDDSGVRFAQRGKHHDSKQPNLVLFSVDGYQKPLLPKTQTKPEPDSAYDYIIETYNKDTNGAKEKSSGNDGGFRHVMKRDVETEDNSTDVGKNSQKSNKEHHHHRVKTRRSQRTGPCSLQPMYVDFQTIGWSDWIISPEGYNANHCTGKCTFPLTNAVNPSNHASVQSLINTLNLDSNIGQPCCVPDKTEHITLLYYTDDDNVVLKHFDGMIATSCGCQ